MVPSDTPEPEPTEPRTPLSRDVVVAGAVALADTDGVQGLTMRKLAKHLGYEVMSLYNHVANKRDLLTAMVDSVTADVERPPHQPDDPLAAVRSIALSIRANLLRHPWSPGLWLDHVPGPERTRVMEDLLRLLSQSDLTPDLAHHGFHAVSNHVLGYTLQELGMAQATENLETDAMDFREGLSPTEHPHTIAHIDQHLAGDTASSFELVLDLILDGIVRLSDQDHGAEEP